MYNNYFMSFDLHVSPCKSFQNRVQTFVEMARTDVSVLVSVSRIIYFFVHFEKTL